MQRRRFAGFEVVIENPSGSTRDWHDRDGRESGRTTMRHDYGFLEGHIGSDGDEVDCYLGPDEEAPFVHVVHQLKAPEFKAHDEDKVMLGFGSEAEAKAGYLTHRNDGDRAYGGMTVLPLERFRQKLARRTGDGKIRHGGAMPNRTEALRGQTVRFDFARQGVRVGLWDRICVPGMDKKDGQETRFDDETLTEMVRNFEDRGDSVMIDWNHQSTYSHENGQPAPALGFYGALAVVMGGQVLALGRAGGVPDQQLDASQLEDGLWGLRTEVTPQGHELLPGFRMLSPTFTPVGVNRQGRRIGYQLLAVAATNTPWQSGTKITFQGVQMASGDRFKVGDKVKTSYGAGEVVGVEPDRSGPHDAILRIRLDGGKEITAPSDSGDVRKMDGVRMASGPGQGMCPVCHRHKTLTPDGKIPIHEYPSGGMCDGGGREPLAGYENTNAASGGKGAMSMNPKILAAATLMGLPATATPKEIRSAFVRKFEGEAVEAATKEGYDFAKHAAHLEEMAKSYEDAHFEEEGADGEPPHQTMRKMAAGFRSKMSKLEKPPEGGHAEPDADDKKDKPPAMEGKEEEKKELAAMAQKMGLPVGASARQVRLAMEGRTTDLAAVGDLKQRIQTLEAERAAELKTERKRSAEICFDQALDQGRTIEEKRGSFVAAYERNPAEAEASFFYKIGSFPTSGREVLMQRMTQGGAPAGVEGRQRATGTPDQRVVKMSALGSSVKGIVYGEQLSGVVSAMADSTEPAVRDRVDRELPEGVKGTRFESFERYMAAERITKRERPDLIAAASEDL